VRAIAAAAIGVLPLVACGSDRAPAPAAPSPVQPVSENARQLLPRDGTTTAISVTSLVPGTSCPALQFMIYTYVFRLSASTVYTGGTCADVQPGSRIYFTGTRETPTSPIFDVATLTFAAAATSPPPPPASTTVPVQTEGTITAVGAGVCPELQFFFGSYAFNVSYATVYSGGACADLRAGARVAITGTKKDTESFVRITSLTFKTTTGTTTPPAAGGRPVEGEGVITAVKPGTSCPSLSFYINEYLIAVAASTVFDAGSCADLAVGTRVHVKGTITDTNVTASSVSVQSQSPARPVVEGEGRVSRLVGGTSCPTLTFMIEEYSVSVDSTTMFVGGSCADIAAGLKLGVRAVATGDKQVLATQIVFKGE
jgi:hypothetical protein